MKGGYRLGLGAVALLGLASIALVQEVREGWWVPGRQLPLPAAASPELREVLRSGPVPNVEAARKAVPADWAREAERNDRAAARAVREAARRASVSLQPATIAGARVHRVWPPAIAREHQNHLLLYFHGGAYVLNAGVAGLMEPVLIAARIGIPVLAVDYRMPPAHPFPAALEDAVAVYRAQLETRDPCTLAVGGTSAGGGLTLALMQRLKSLGLPLPGAMYLGTPWADLTKTGDSLWINEGIDRLLVTYDGPLHAAARLYAGGHDLRDPLLSPVYGDFAGLPPAYLVTGTRDLFLSHTIRVHRRLREAGVPAELNVYEGLSHGDYIGVPDSPESRAVYRELGAFLSRHLSSADPTHPRGGETLDPKVSGTTDGSPLDRAS